MKPIKLEIDGINSYSTKQVIDFEKLTSKGIFGIFGKTGSGKSTILDAITLALYGNIARGSKEFINSNRDRASVSYTFDLGLGTDRTRYIISRRFKKNERAGKVTSTSDYVRLISKRPGGEYEILADKVGEVNSQIKDILGLEESDFLKSVVLPQGRFGEFLSLTGKDRRNMLERIFNLEEYGSDLNISLSRKKRQVGDQISIIEAKLAEYPDVNQDSYKKLENEISDIEKEVANNKKSLEAEEKKYLDYKEIVGLIEEKKRLDESEREILSVRDKIENLRYKLEVSRVFFGISDEITKLDKLKIDLGDTTKNIDLIEKKAIIISDRLEKESKDLSKLEVNLRTLSLDNKYKVGVREAYQLSLSLKELEDNRTKQEKLIVEEEENTNNIKKRLYINNEKSCKIKEDIDRLVQSINKSQDIKSISDDQLLNLNTQLHDINTRISRYEEEQVKYENLNVRHSERQAKISKLKVSLNLKDIEIDKARTSLEKLLKENVQVKIHEIATDLKTILQEEGYHGKSCPICGSKMESISSGYGGNIDLDHNKKKVNSAKKNLDRLIEEIDLDKMELGKLEGQASLDKEEVNRIKDLLASIDIASIRRQFNDKKKYLNKQISIKNKKEREIGALHEEKDLLSKEKNIIDLAVNDLIVGLESGKSRLEIYRSNFVKLDGDIINLRDKLDLLKLDLGITDVGQEYMDVQKKEEAFDILNNKLIDQAGLIEKLKLEEKEVLDTFNDLSTKKQVIQGRIETILSREDFKDIDRIRREALSKEDYTRGLVEVETYDKKRIEVDHFKRSIMEKLGGRSIDETKLLDQKNICSSLSDSLDKLKDKLSSLNYQYKKMGEDLILVTDFINEVNESKLIMDSLLELERVLRGNKFVEYLAQTYLQNIVYDASERLDLITSGRYALEIGGEYAFVVRDNYKGGLRRSADTLSGGENFLVSLSLALALSSQIQLKGSAPLEFFFLDEGFGSLDKDLLDTVMTSLERLQGENMSVGIISHVEELKNMIPAKLEVDFDDIESSSKVKLSW